tara:strand:+ start:1002 stop:1403 length:402 start_codon:yes stop_codon:yes gene_type:complete
MWDKYTEDLHIKWPFSFSNENMHTFAELSNDFNPLHNNNEFAQSKGFQAPVVYGLLLCTQMSRLIGQELPDKNAILTGIRMDFISPSYPDDELIFEAELITKSTATNALEFKCLISKNEKIMCRGNVSAIWRP